MLDVERNSCQGSETTPSSASVWGSVTINGTCSEGTFEACEDRNRLACAYVETGKSLMRRKHGSGQELPKRYHGIE